ncbi:alpha-(1,3)-fucosyltransferase fut-6-like [Convolutriloba macropyga]|uniref:alpha-(1,3)-fucosyltransferase fut-6-like n=1 Tax=Convolutriloba macropyga TaxID=536237 RepID=UPI003F526C80
MKLKIRLFLIAVAFLLTSLINLLIHTENGRTKIVTNEIFVSILVYSDFRTPSDGAKDIQFEGNIRDVCNLSFDCFLHQRHKTSNIDSKFFNSLSAVIIANEGIYQLQRDIDQFKEKSERNFKRDPKQVWISWSMESSINERSWMFVEEHPQFKSHFNWTVFPSRYATIHRRVFSIDHKPEGNNEEAVKLIDKGRFLNRSKDFCWIVSNCDHTWNSRNKLGSQLIQHLSSPVHFWGSAIIKNCFKIARRNFIDHGIFSGIYSHYFDLVQERLQDCKFYIAFENSNCSDYVTEKFLNAIEAGAIPIVNGWPKTYEQLLPGSFIHVNKFDNIPLLARYLRGVLNNETEFLNFHKWRTNYDYTRMSFESSCQICRKLRDLKVLQKLDGKREMLGDLIDDITFHVKNLQQCGS